MTIVVRPPVVEDVEGMAEVHVASWRETYQDVMPHDVLYAPDLFERRKQLWAAYFTGDNHKKHSVAVADLDGRIVGVAMAGASRDEDRPDDTQLSTLYTRQSIHGSGTGTQLLEAVLQPDVAASLWVSEPNPRAQAFYRKHGFQKDGSKKRDEALGVVVVRMVRHPRA